jgi:hypothetical protein
LSQPRPDSPRQKPTAYYAKTAEIGAELAASIHFDSTSLDAFGGECVNAYS